MKKGFPKFLGGHLTRFRRSHGKGGCFLIANHRYWYNRIVYELRELNAVLPPNARADHDILPASWREEHVNELVIGMVEEYNQLVNIAQRESLPVTQLKEEFLTSLDDEEHLQLMPINERRAMVRDALPRHQQYYKHFVENFNLLVTY